jgi:hypothetical protein
VQSQAIRDLIVRYSDLLLAHVQQSVACNALHTLEARLCRWLLQTHDCMDGDVIPLTQEYLGQMLGVRRTTVTIAARLLQSAGLIRYRRGHIQILDRATLEDITCECYGVVRQNADKVFPPPPRKNRSEIQPLAVGIRAARRRSGNLRVPQAIFCRRRHQPRRPPTVGLV